MSDFDKNEYNKMYYEKNKAELLRQRKKDYAEKTKDSIKTPTKTKFDTELQKKEYNKKYYEANRRTIQSKYVKKEKVDKPKVDPKEYQKAYYLKKKANIKALKEELEECKKKLNK